MKKDSITRKDVHDAAVLLELEESKTTRLIEMVFPPPKFGSWIKFTERILLILGVVFLLSGTIFFFAYNWREMNHFTKLSIVTGLLISTGIFAAFISEKKFLSRILLISVFILTGLLMALYGQIYQTGANAYDLFLNWTILTIPLILISKSLAAWMLWVIVLNLSVFFFSGQVIRDWINPYCFLVLTFINIISIFIYEMIMYRFRINNVKRWFAQLMALYTYIWLVIGTIMGIINDFESYGHSFIFIITCFVIISTIYIYNKKIRDLVIIALSCLAIIPIIFIGFIKLAGFNSVEVFFIGGILIIVLTAASVSFLIYIKKSWDNEEKSI